MYIFHVLVKVEAWDESVFLSDALSLGMKVTCKYTVGIKFKAAPL